MMTVDINYADREIDILKNNGDRGIETILHYFTGITTTCLKMVSGLAWQANVDNNPHFLTLENHFQILKNIIFQY